MASRYTRAAAAVAMAVLLATSGVAGVASTAATAGADDAQALERTQAGNETAGGNASVTVQNQTTNGTAVTVESVTLPDGGFVEITDENGVPIGHTEYLDAGSYEGLTVSLDRPLAANQTVTVFVLRDANGNQAYDGTGPGNGTDATYTTAAGETVADEASVQVAAEAEPADAAQNETNVTPDNQTNVTAENQTNVTTGNETNVTMGNETNVTAQNETNVTNVTAENETNVTGNATNETTRNETNVTADNVTNATAQNQTNVTPDNQTNVTAENETNVTGNVTNETPSLAFQDQSSNGSAVVVERATLPRGGFVVVHTAALLDGQERESVVGVSAHLAPGTHRNVTVPLDEPIADSQRLVAVAYRDTDGDGTFAFYEQNRSVDAPYVRDGGSAVADAASVTVEAGNATADGGNATADAGNATVADENATAAGGNATADGGNATG